MITKYFSTNTCMIPIVIREGTVNVGTTSEITPQEFMELARFAIDEFNSMNKTDHTFQLIAMAG